MFLVIISKSSGILGPIVNILGYIMNYIYEFFRLMGIENIAISIIMFTFITKVIMIPLTIKQQKFTRLQSIMNPEIQAITAKYKGKKDEQSLRRQQAETQEVYKKYGASPTAGCLPMLLTLPIMLALYSVINNIPSHVNSIKEIYEVIANTISTSNPEGYATFLMEMAKEMAIKTNKFQEFTSSGQLDINHIIDILSKFKESSWDKLLIQFASEKDIIIENVQLINKANNFLGFNIAENPGWKFPGIIIPIVSMAFNFIQTKQMSATSNTAADDQTAATMQSMNTIMPIMSGVFTVMMPIGVGLYWISSSIFTIISQFFINKYLDKTDIGESIKKNVEKQNKKTEKMLNSPNETIRKMASQYTKSIETNDDDNKNSNQENSFATGSISEIANILKNRNVEKGDKK